MESAEDSETSAEFKRTSGMYPKEHIQYSKTDESLKSRLCRVLSYRGSVKKMTYTVLALSDDIAMIVGNSNQTFALS